MIRFEYKGKKLEGTIIKEQHGELTIKLPNGYNIIVPKKEAIIKSKECMMEEKKTKNKEKKNKPEKKSDTKREKRAPEYDPKKKKILILHTGGTVASRVDYKTGAVIAQFSPEEILSMFPELREIANIDSRLVANIQSEMMRFAHWNLLAEAVEDAIKKEYDGIIITHGTDIMHMTAAALEFALEGLDKPVILVGSQRSSDRPSSDAASNLLCAAAFIAKTEFKGVGICMHESITKEDCWILPPTKSRKMHTSRRDAFKPINDKPYARIEYPSLKIKEESYPVKENNRERLKVRPFREDLKVGILKIHPQMWLEELQAYERFDGLIIELLGIGHAPTMVTDPKNKHHEAIMAEIRLLCQHMPVAATPQTIYGRINMNIYSPGRQLIEAGVLGQGLDMTPETAFVKLSWLLSNYPKEKVKELYSQNLRGEIKERITDY